MHVIAAFTINQTALLGAALEEMCLHIKVIKLSDFHKASLRTTKIKINIRKREVKLGFFNPFSQ